MIEPHVWGDVRAPGFEPESGTSHQSVSSGLGGGLGEGWVLFETSLSFVFSFFSVLRRMLRLCRVFVFLFCLTWHLALLTPRSSAGSLPQMYSAACRAACQSSRSC